LGTDMIASGHILRLGLRTLVTFLALFSDASLAKCLTGLTATSESPNEVLVSWTYSCSLDKLEKVKVYYYHDGFLACSDGRKDGTRPAGFGHTKVFASNYSDSVTVDGVHPASRYMIEVADVRLDGSRQSKEYTEVETKEGLPQVGQKYLLVSYLSAKCQKKRGLFKYLMLKLLIISEYKIKS